MTLSHRHAKVKGSSPATAAYGNGRKKGGKSAASFCRQVAAWFPVMFCNFYLVKNQEIATNSTATKAREKIITDLKSLEF